MISRAHGASCWPNSSIRECTGLSSLAVPFLATQDYILTSRKHQLHKTTELGTELGTKQAEMQHYATCLLSRLDHNTAKFPLQPTPNPKQRSSKASNQVFGG